MNEQHCRACGYLRRQCIKLWVRQAKCCPDCSHGPPALPQPSRSYGVRQLALTVQRTLDLEPLLRGVLLAQMAAVLWRPPEEPACGTPWRRCLVCSELVEDECWRPGEPRCRACMRRAVSRLVRESQAISEGVPPA